MTPSLLILAAGAGSRYGGLKQIDPVGPAGESILDYSVHDAIRAGFGKFVFVIRKSFEADFRRVIGARYENQVEVEYAFQESDDLPAGYQTPANRTKPWGTGHAVLAARDLIREPFAVINADDYYGHQAFQLLADFLRKDTPQYTLIAYELANTLSEHGTVSRGICEISPENQLMGVREVTAIEAWKSGARAPLEGALQGQYEAFTGEELVSMNCWGFTPGIFEQLQQQFADFLAKNGSNPKAEFYLPAAVDWLIQQNMAQVQVQRTPDSWFGMTYPQDKLRVCQSIQELVNRGLYPSGLHQVGAPA